MPATLDTKDAHLVRYHGDIAAVYSWLEDQRALFLVPHLRPGAPWFVVPEPSAYAWNDEDPDTARDVAGRAAKACEVLGLEPTTRNAYRIAKIVVEGIPDLIKMPSKPPDRLGAALGEMRALAEGQLVGGEEIRLPESTTGMNAGDATVTDGAAAHG